MDVVLDCRVTVPAGVTTDLSGTPNSAATYTYSYTPPNPSYTTVSKTVNAVGGATMGAAVVAPLAVGLLASGQFSFLPPSLFVVWGHHGPLACQQGAAKSPSSSVYQAIQQD